MKVLDASALLACLFEERGGETVNGALRGSVMSVVNLAEVLQRFHREKKPTDGLIRELEMQGLHWDEPTVLDATIVGRLGEMKNISLGDRFCIVLGVRLGAPVMTADRDWASYKLPISIEFIR